MRRIGLTCFALIAILIGCAQETKQTKKEKSKDGEDPAIVWPVLLRGPYLQEASATRMLIRWRTDAFSRSRVWYGSDTATLNQIADDSALVTEHKVLLTGLQPMTRYYYTIGGIKDKLQGDTGNYFYTLPEKDAVGTYRIAALGDCGNNSVNQRAVRDQLIRRIGAGYLQAWLLLGDNTYPDGTDAEFQTNFFNVYKDNLLKKYPLFPAPGNHDYHDIEYTAAVAQQTHAVAYYQNFSMPEDGQSGGVASHTPSYYSFDIGNIHFLSLDSYGKMDNARLSDTLGAQLQWIKQDLEQAKGAMWIVAYWHHPPYTKGSHDGDTEKELVDIRQQLLPVLDRYGVDLILGGHSHDYERSRPLYGYYGNSQAFDSTRYLTSLSSGRADGSPNSAPYIKKSRREKGTIYVVTGSAGKLGGEQADFPHRAMLYSDATHGGASLLTVTGNQLQFEWICADGVIRDRFTILKKLNP